MLKLSKKERKTLQNHRFVEKVTEKQVIFSAKFKLQSVKMYFKGKSAQIIFNEAGFSPEIFSSKYISGCLNRWKKAFNENGINGLTLSKRGRKAIHSTNYKNMKLQDLLERIEYLEQENDFLKKLKALAKK